MDITYITYISRFMQSSKKFQIYGVLTKNEISINTISPGEEQIDKQAKYHLYVLDIGYIQLHLKFHANPSNSLRSRGFYSKIYYQLTQLTQVKKNVIFTSVRQIC